MDHHGSSNFGWDKDNPWEPQWNRDRLMGTTRNKRYKRLMHSYSYVLTTYCIRGMILQVEKTKSLWRWVPTCSNLCAAGLKFEHLVVSWLVVWNMAFIFPYFWEWWSQLTNSCFSEGLKPPTSVMSPVHCRPLGRACRHCHRDILIMTWS